MNRLAFILCAALVAAPAFAQKTNDQATEEGRVVTLKVKGG